MTSTPRARSHHRTPDELRPLEIRPDEAPFAEGSCLIATGRTRVLCTASVLDEVPEWKRDRDGGWVTAEYAMLPRATPTRSRRERGRPRGRTQEIERLIGRSLRSVVDLGGLGERTVLLDCDVLQADGGTRTAAVTGACVALQRALRGLVDEGALEASPLREPVAAVSVGVVDGVPLLDLDYEEDAAASVDLNVVGTAEGHLVEVQGTAEGVPFSRKMLDRLVDLATEGIQRLCREQARLFGGDTDGGSGNGEVPEGHASEPSGGGA